MLSEGFFGASKGRISEPCFGTPNNYAPESKKFFTKVGMVDISGLPERDKFLLDSSIKELKEDGQWDELNFLFIDALASKRASLINVCRPEQEETLVNDYAGSFVQYKGKKGNGTTFRVNTNVNPGSGETTNFTHNSATHCVYVNSTDLSSGMVDISADSSANVGAGITIFNATKQLRAGVSGSYAAVGSGLFCIEQGYGWHGVTRTSPNSFFTHKNGVTKQPNTAVSDNIPNIPIYRFCRNVNGTFSVFSSRFQSCYYGGSGNINNPVVQKSLEKYMMAVGAIPRKQVIIHGNSFTQAGVYTQRLFSNYSAVNEVADFTRGDSGLTTLQLTGNFRTFIAPAIRSYYDGQLLIIQELTNSFFANASDIDLTIAHLRAYIDQALSYRPKKIGIVTMPPRNQAQIDNLKRQNDSNLLDPLTLNGQIRLNYASWGAHFLVDVGADTTIGIYSNGVAGVGEKNTTYYAADELHLTNPVGYQYYTDQIFYPSVVANL